MAGNLVPVTKSGDQPSFTFHAFHENRLPLVVRVRDMTQMASARIAFMSESRVMRGDSPLAPTCTLNINLPEFAPGWGSKIDDDEESETIEQYQRSSKHLGKCFCWLSLMLKCETVALTHTGNCRAALHKLTHCFSNEKLIHVTKTHSLVFKSAISQTC